MKTNTILTILIAILSFGCQTKEKGLNESNSSDTTVTRSNVESDTVNFAHAEDKRAKSVKTIISYVDSLYGIKSASSTDSLFDFRNIKSNPTVDNSYGLLDYAKNDISKYYQHLSFHFYVFKNRLPAADNFKELIRLSKIKDLDFDTEEGSKYLNLFSKGGCTYILYEHIIILHIRRCNYNETIEKPREGNLASFLFDNKTPLDNYLLRVSCGWTNAEIK